MASILEWNANYARENNLPSADAFAKLLATPGGATLFDHQYHINNWEDLAEGLAEQLASQLEAKGTKNFIVDNAQQITYAGAGARQDDQDFKNFVQTINTIPLSQTEADKVNNAVQQGVADLRESEASVARFYSNFNQPGGGFGNLAGDVGRVTAQLAANPVVQVGIAYYMPGVVESFAPSLTAIGITSPAAQTAVANAIASTAVQVAQGVPIENALQTAVTNAVVSSGSPAIARDINKVIENPSVTDAIVSAGSSAAKTALNGGSQSDIERNLIGGLVGSGVASTTGSNVAGATAGGAVTGGVTGALQGAASAYGSQAAADERASRQTSEFVSGINLAAADTGTASDAGGGMAVDVSGTPIFADSSRAASVKAPFGFAVMPIEMADNKPEGAYYDYTQNAWIAPVTDIEKFTTMSPITSGDVGAGRPSVAPGVDLTQPTTFSFSDNPTISSGYNPNIISTSGITFSGGGNTANATFNPNIALPNIAKISGSNQQSNGVNVVGGGNTPQSLDIVNVVGKKETPSLGTVNVVGGNGTTPSLGTVNVTGKRETPTLDTVYVTAGGEDIPSLDTVNVKATPDKEDIPSIDVELPPVEDKKGTPVSPYTPKIFTYGGVKSTLPATLATTLAKTPTASTTTGTSVGLGGRGEIESKESGKKRQNVWNEESLRLKDALGL